MNTVTDPLPASCTTPGTRTAAVTPAPQPLLLGAPALVLPATASLPALLLL
jgi:hypothetical protein